MKYLVLQLIVSAFFNSFQTQAQYIYPEPSDSIFNIVDRMPLFPDICNETVDKLELGECTNKWIYYHITQEIKWSLYSRFGWSNLEKFHITFKIDTNGRIMAPKIVDELSDDINEVILTSIMSLPQLEPAIKNGLPVPFAYTINYKKNNKKSNEYKIHTIAESSPVFPGECEEIRPRTSEHTKCNEEKVKSFIQSVVLYPEVVEEYWGTKIVAEFVVTKKGNVELVKIIRGAHPSLDSEVIAAIKKLPQFKPATMKGRPVNYKYTIPISFNDKSKTLVQKKDSNSENNPVIKDHSAIFSGKCELVENPSEQLECTEQRIHAFIQGYLEYPDIDKEYRIEGRAYVSFIISEEGKVEEIKLLKGVNKSLDAAALKVVRLLSATVEFIPAMKYGKAAQTKFTVPVNFRLPPE